MQKHIRSAQRGISLLGAFALIVLILVVSWTAFLVSTRGWEQTRQDVRSAFQGAAYAAKETSEDAALTAKVKTAFTLSRRVPSSRIDVDSQGGVVTLRGDVPSEDARKQAESIARDVPGVQEVQNHLFVASPSR
jgi:osmotically-inducible protein OsmY